MTKKMMYEEVLCRLLMKMIEFIIVPVLVVLMIIAINGDRKIEALEKELGIEGITVYPERISIEDGLKWHVDGLPIPEDALVLENAEVKEVVETKVENQIASEEEVILLAKLMHAEEGVLRYKLSAQDAKRAHMLCGSVVLHRKNMHYLGANTIADVIYEPGQYASIQSLEQEVPEETIEWARELIQIGPLGPEDMIYQAEFEQGQDTYEHIGNQYFCTISKIK